MGRSPRRRDPSSRRRPQAPSLAPSCLFVPVKTHEEKFFELLAEGARLEAQRAADRAALEEKLAAIRFARMGLTSALYFLRWLCEKLVNALLRPVWIRIVRAKGARCSLLFRRFEALVNGADCWPCRVQYALGGGLFITSSGQDFDEDFN